jgi:signal peptidase I
VSHWPDTAITTELPRLGPPRRPSAPSAPSALRRVLSTIRLLIICLAVFLAARTVVPTVAIEGESMSPTLHTGGRVVLNGIYRFGTPHRGDIVVFHPPFPAESPYIKRVIALPGETIQIRDGTVFINDEPLREDYLLATATLCRAHCSLTVPEDAVFVMGDNRSNSSDSRDFGPIMIDSILGEALFSLWPPGTVD